MSTVNGRLCFRRAALAEQGDQAGEGNRLATPDLRMQPGVQPGRFHGGCRAGHQGSGTFPAVGTGGLAGGRGVPAMVFQITLGYVHGQKKRGSTGPERCNAGEAG